jgi:hypothetical protein
MWNTRADLLPSLSLPPYCLAEPLEHVGLLGWHQPPPPTLHRSLTSLPPPTLVASVINIVITAVINLLSYWHPPNPDAGSRRPPLAYRLRQTAPPTPTMLFDVLLPGPRRLHDLSRPYPLANNLRRGVNLARRSPSHHGSSLELMATVDADCMFCFPQRRRRCRLTCFAGLASLVCVLTA